MRIPRVYHPHSFRANTTITLDGGAAHYLLKVLRMSVGREVILFDGNGCEYDATIEAATKSTVTVAINRCHAITRQSKLEAHLAIGISRGERFDWVLQKAAELGVRSITPLLTERVEVKIKPDRMEKKIQHWQQIIVSACEQCQLNVLPILHSPIKISDWISTENSDRKLVLDHRGEPASLKQSNKPNSAAVLIGSEGGLTENEIFLAKENGFESLQLGPRVLRTETAPIVALSVLQYEWGDFC